MFSEESGGNSHYENNLNCSMSPQTGSSAALACESQTAPSSCKHKGHSLDCTRVSQDPWKWTHDCPSGSCPCQWHTEYSPISSSQQTKSYCKMFPPHLSLLSCAVTWAFPIGLREDVPAGSLGSSPVFLGLNFLGCLGTRGALPGLLFI